MLLVMNVHGQPLAACCRDWYHAHSIATSSLEAPRVLERDLCAIANLRNLRVIPRPSPQQQHTHGI